VCVTAEGKTEQEIKAIMLYRMTLLQPDMQVSAEEVDFFHRALYPDPALRWDADQLFAHPWIAPVPAPAPAAVHRRMQLSSRRSTAPTTKL